MLNKDDLLASILAECDICVHLATKIPDGGLDYRPSDTQRTTLELLRYTAFCAIGATVAMRDGHWEGYQEWAERCAELTAADYPDAMERQKAALTEAFAALTEAQLVGPASHPMGHEITLETALIELPLKWMAAYKMQLFLYAKAAGNDEIRTPDVWAGVTLPRDASPA